MAVFRPFLGTLAARHHYYYIKALGQSSGRLPAVYYSSMFSAESPIASCGPLVMSITVSSPSSSGRGGGSSGLELRLPRTLSDPFDNPLSAWKEDRHRARSRRVRVIEYRHVSDVRVPNMFSHRHAFVVFVSKFKIGLILQCTLFYIV